MTRNRIGSIGLAAILAVAMAACTAGAPATPAPTAEVINPPVIKEEGAATTAPEPTAAPEATTAPEPTAAEEKPAAEEAPFVLNGVTLPFKRSEAIVNDQVNFGVFDSFNLFIPNGNEFAAGHQQIAIEYLWYVNYATGDIIPWLADSYEYNDDYTEMKIHLNQKAKWNDGVPFTANDIVFTYDMRMKDTAALGNPNPDGKIDTLTAEDDYTAVYKFTSPQPRFHLNFWCRICTAAGSVNIVPKHVWESVDPKTFKNNPPVATGPYKLMRTYPEQKIYVWERNEDYWNKDQYFPAAKYVVYRTGPGAEQQLAEVQTNNMDIFGMDYKVYTEKKAELSQLNYVLYVDPCPRAIWFNRGKAPFDKPEFARAMSMVMNRQKWADNIWIPPSRPAKGLWADYRNMDKYINPDSAANWKTFEYNPDEAMKLLEGLGYKKDGATLMGPDGNAVTFNVGTPVGPGGSEYLIAQDWIEDLKAIGIEATLSNYEQPPWFAKTSNGDYDAGVWWFCGATVDPFELYSGFTCDRVSPIGERAINGNEQRYCNAQFDEVVNKLAAITPDAPEAMDLYHQAFDIWMSDPPGVPLIETLYSAAFNTTYWDNMPSNDNLYTVPFNWWGQILWVEFNAKPK